MYLIYVDESGKPPFSDPENYTLSAVIIHEQKWGSVNASINRLKRRYFPSVATSKIEFHTKEILRGHNRFHRFNINKRLDIMDGIANLIAAHDLTLITTLIDKNKIYSYLKQTDWVERKAWLVMFERLEKFLSKRNTSSTVIEDYGLLTMDSENLAADNRIRKRIRWFKSMGTGYVKGRFVIEDPFFVSSENRNFVQLADFVAWVSRRWYRNLIGISTSVNEPRYLKMYQTIEPKFDSSIAGKIDGYGFKIYP